MAGFDFGGIMSSIANLNFVFGGAKSMPQHQKIDDFNETAVLDDILRTNFNGDIYKNDMMEFFAPSLSTTDDILDKLIQELDKNQEAESNGQSFSSDQGGSNFDTTSVANDFDSSSTSPFSIESDQTSFDHRHEKPFSPTTSDLPSYAFDSCASSQTNSAAHPYHCNARSAHTQKYAVCLTTPTCAPTNHQQSGTFATPTFCNDSAYDVPPLAETVEIECSQEHSYATHTQHHNYNSGSARVSLVAKQPSKDGASSASSGRMTSPFSSSASMRSSFSSCDSYQPSNQSKHSGKKSIDWQQHIFPYSSNPTGCRRPLKVEKFDVGEVEETDEYLERDNSAVSLIGRSFGERGDGPWFKHGSKRRCKSQFLLPFSYTELRGDEKYPSLMLSDEERLLCEKEGVKLPTKFPLTKHEERELRRVKRKIRNKLSAQESRRKKNEYINSLEDRVRACDRDNQTLRRQVEALSSSNQSIAEQLKRLQSSIGNGSTKQTVQAGTCLAVLLLSFALLVAPNNNLFGKQSKHDENQFGMVFGEENVPAAENSQSVETPAGPNQQKFIFPSNTRTLLPHASDLSFGSNDQLRGCHNANVVGTAELDSDPPSFYFVGDGGGVAGKRPLASLGDVEFGDKRLKRRHVDADRFAAVAKEVWFPVDENKSDFLANLAENEIDFAAVGKKNFDVESFLAINGVDFAEVVKKESADFAAVVANPPSNRLAMVATEKMLDGVHWFLADRDEAINVSSTPAPVPSSTTVTWRSNQRPIKAEDF